MLALEYLLLGGTSKILNDAEVLLFILTNLESKT